MEFLKVKVHSESPLSFFFIRRRFVFVLYYTLQTVLTMNNSYKLIDALKKKIIYIPTVALENVRNSNVDILPLRLA